MNHLNTWLSWILLKLEADLPESFHHMLLQVRETVCKRSLCGL